MTEDPQHIGPWRITGELGRGGAGVVYRAEHIDTGRPAAVKVLHAHRTADAAERTALRREIEVLSALEHPGIVRIRDQGGVDTAQDDVPWLAMDLVDGVPLRSCIPTGDVGTFAFDGFDQFDESADPVDPVAVDAPRAPTADEPDQTVLRALGHLVHTVAWLHGQGIVHRDIKPDNVLLVDGRAVLVDFGMASIARSRDTPVERPGGSPGYMAPEQLRGEPVDARADLYSLGCLITEVWTGQRPHPTHRQPLSDATLEACVGPLLADDPAKRSLDRARLAERFGVPAFGPTPDRAILRPPFVGRPDVEAALDSLRATQRGSLLVLGAPGMGKTRVLSEAHRRARHAGQPVFFGRRVWRDVVGQVVAHRLSGLDPANVASLAAAAEQLGVDWPSAAPPSLVGDAARLRALDGVRVALDHLAAVRPVWVAFDDLHTASAFDIDALCWIARSQRVQPRSIVLVASWDADVPVPSGLSDSIPEQLALPPLPEGAMHVLAGSVWLERRPNDAGRVAVAVREARGNPHRCIEELRIGQTAFDAPFELRVVERLQRRLRPTARAFVEATALAIDVLDEAGPDAPVDADLVGRAVGLHGRDISLALHEARREGFIDVLDGQLVFAQRRVLAVTLNSLEPDARRRLHDALASESAGPSRAVHLVRAGRRRAGLQVWLQQVEDAVEGSAPHARAVVRSWALWEVSEDGPIPPNLASMRGQIALHQQDYALGREALRIAVERGEPSIQTDALLALIRHLPSGSEEVSRALEQLEQLAERTGDQLLALQHQANHLIDQLTSGALSLTDALAASDGLLAQARNLSGAQTVVARLQAGRGSFLLRLGRPRDADLALAEAQRQGSLPPDYLCGLHGNRGAAAYEQGDVQGALDHTLANVRQARTLGVLRSEASALSNLSLLLSGCGRRTEGHRMAGAAFVRTLRFERVTLLIGPALRLVDDLLAWDDWRSALGLARACASASASVGNRLWVAEAQVRVARAQALLGDLDSADALLADLPTQTRDQVAGLRQIIEAVRAGRMIRPSSSEAAMILGVCGSAEQRTAAGDTMRSGFEKKGLAVLRNWAVRFGVEGLAEAVPLAPLPADIDALGTPLEPVLPVVARLLAGR